MIVYGRRPLVSTEQNIKLNTKMTTHIFKKTLTTCAYIFVLSAIIGCNSNTITKTNDRSSITAGKEIIPDSVVQFLITSASHDFRHHQPPTAIDFLNVKIGYLASPNNEKIFLLCGEFLSKENKEWVEFTTIKTSGYEQYLGKTQYCQDATMILTGKNLSSELKNKLNE